MSKTCSSCLHWQMNPQFSSHDPICAPTDPDTYTDMVMPFDVRECMHPSLVKFERPVEQNGFGVTDGSNYQARLCTGPDFGCVRHELLTESTAV